MLFSMFKYNVLTKIWTLISRNLRKKHIFPFGNVGTITLYNYCISVWFIFSWFYCRYLSKTPLASLYTRGRPGNIFRPAFWHDFHMFCILAISTAVCTTSQSRFIRFKVFFKAVEPYIYLDWGCWTVKTLTTGCPKQCQFPLQHMWGSARLCKRQLPCKMYSQITTFIIFPIYLRINAFRRIQESITSTPHMPAVLYIHDHKRLVHLNFTQLSLDVSLK